MTTRQETKTEIKTFPTSEPGDFVQVRTDTTTTHFDFGPMTTVTVSMRGAGNEAGEWVQMMTRVEQ